MPTQDPTPEWPSQAVRSIFFAVERGSPAYRRLMRRCAFSRLNVFQCIEQFGDPRDWLDEPPSPVRAEVSLKSRPRPIDAYRRWWVGQHVRRAGSSQPFREVAAVEWIGPPSGVYGCVELRFADGTTETLHSRSFRPRKCDLEISNPNPPTRT